ncbi:hypothetical protein K435DRAFT_878714 [Dendrothele bispora CBS 962.96]|uniref:Secreted protein n=1 Tax=Dendrothele bispora (strain CBS 962.96) TaxID=1314807 RepID=A0A4S8KMS6_DENBC|nr:hypothetical protein K435DRAFT_878714 [Dendrothele bispora CBS 962.96]
MPIVVPALLLSWATILRGVHLSPVPPPHYAHTLEPPQDGYSDNRLRKGTTADLLTPPNCPYLKHLGFPPKILTRTTRPPPTNTTEDMTHAQ